MRDNRILVVFLPLGLLVLGFAIAQLAKPKSSSVETNAGADELSQAAEVISLVEPAAKLSGLNTVAVKEHALYTTMPSQREVETNPVVGKPVDHSAAHSFEKEKSAAVAPASATPGHPSVSRDRAFPSSTVMASSTQSIQREPLAEKRSATRSPILPTAPSQRLAPVAVLAPNPGSLGLSPEAQETVEALADYFVDAVGEPDLASPNGGEVFMSRVRQAASETDAYIRLHYGHHAYVQLQLQASRQRARE